MSFYLEQFASDFLFLNYAGGCCVHPTFPAYNYFNNVVPKVKAATKLAVMPASWGTQITYK